MDRETRRILVVDDNRLMLTLVSDHLKQAGYQVYTAQSGIEALKLVETETLHLIILDVVMPDMDGYEVVRQLRNNTRSSHIPIILLSSRGKLADKVQGFESGADDYITKPFESEELVVRVMAHLRRARRARSVSPLTGLPGNVRIEEELKSRVESGEPYAVLYIDMDNFKAYNDAYGFLQGDQAIKLLARTIEEVSHDLGCHDALIGHIGGDDFVFITAPVAIDEICLELIKRFEQSVRALYNSKDRERGYVIFADRVGKEQQHPLISLSIAVVTNEKRNFSSHWEISEVAAEIKHRAKNLPGSVYIRDVSGWGVDQRSPSPANKAVLVVENTPLISRLAKDFLKQRGYQTHLAANAILALQFLKSRLPDLIALDVSLLGALGFTLCRRLKDDPQTRRIPVVMVISAGDEERAQQAGADAYLSLPFNTQQLTDTIGNLLPDKKAEQISS